MTTVEGTDLEEEVVTGVIEEEEQTASPPYFLTNKGEVVYIADSQGCIDKITADARKYQNEFYYVLALNEPKSNDPAQMTLFRVNDNLVSISYVPASGSSLELIPLKNTALYKLAKLPWELMQKVEQFFRKVDQDLGGSEAIVVLAFDERFESDDPEGWRVIVPRQNNSAAHCNYDPTSIADFIDDEDFNYVRQVGTIHSHPGMSAFASHTDEKDQATFDGVHITIGWKGNFTEFHAEIQAGGQNFLADPDLVINMPESEKKDYPEFGDWATRVKKETVGGPKVTTFSSGATKTTVYKTPTPGTSMGSLGGPYHTEGIKPPANCPSITLNTVVTNLLTGTDNICPVCKEILTPAAKELRRCRNCQAFVLFKGEEITDAIRVRKAQDRPIYELEPENAKRPIAFWRRESESVSTVEITAVSGSEGELPKVPGTQLIYPPTLTEQGPTPYM